jgi:hypothetical protein
MDATRKRRTKDQARRLYYAGHRQHRFAKHMGFAAPSPAAAGPRAQAMFAGTDEHCILRPSDRGLAAITEAVASQHLMLQAG